MNSLLGLFGRREHVISPAGVEGLMRKHIAYERLEDAAIPVHVMATDVLTGAEVTISRGPVVEALRASTAIPGVFPPVHIGHHYLMDGGVANNAPLGTPSISAPTSYTCSPLATPAA